MLDHIQSTPASLLDNAMRHPLSFAWYNTICTQGHQLLHLCWLACHGTCYKWSLEVKALKFVTNVLCDILHAGGRTQVYEHPSSVSLAACK